MNLTGFKTALIDLADALVNRRPRNAARIFLVGLRKDVRGAFAAKADPETGRPWPPRKDDLPHQLLVKSGAMMAAALRAVDGAQQSSAGVVVSLSGPPYAGFHQRGTARLPRRRFFGVTPETRAAATKAYADEIVSLSVGGRPA